MDTNGGILVSGTAAFTPSGGYTISGGTITSGDSGANSKLYTWIDSGVTTINSVIADIGGGATTLLAKAGNGTLVLGGATPTRRHGPRRRHAVGRQFRGPRHDPLALNGPDTMGPQPRTATVTNRHDRMERRRHDPGGQSRPVHARGHALRPFSGSEDLNKTGRAI